MAVPNGLGTAGIVAVPIPPDGPLGTVLTKVTAADYDMAWMAGGGGGGAIWGTIIGTITDQTDLVNLINSSIAGIQFPSPGVALALLDDYYSEDSISIPGPPGASGSGSTGPAGPAGPAILMSLDDVDVEYPPVLPGARGIDGSPGVAGLQIFMQAEDLDTEPAPIVPGTPGAAGTPGVAGLQIFMQAEDVDTEPAPIVPGINGTSGTNGTAGATGPAVFLEAEPGEDGLTIVGPQGIQGPSGGGGGGTVTEAEIDFGTKPVFDALFSIVDGTVGATNKIVVSESGKPATGRVAGDAQWDSILMAANPATGSFSLFCRAQPGPVVGKRKIQYSVAA